MARLIDLSHDFYDGMPGFKMQNEDGSTTQFSVSVKPFVTHQQSSPNYQGLASFEITEMTFQTSIGTYLDSPYHRYPDGRDISKISLDEVILPGVVIDVRNKAEFEEIGRQSIPQGLTLKGKAVLFNFGWDAYWGTEKYSSYPYLSEDVIDYLIGSDVKLVGVDTENIDNTNNLSRPAHTKLLKNEILIVENLTGLDGLYGTLFRFFAVPLKARDTAAIPIRAFAEQI